jgi:hypothetical protein
MVFVNILKVKKIELKDDEIIIRCKNEKSIIEDLLNEYGYEGNVELDESLKEEIIKYISKEKRIYHILKFKDFIEKYNIQIDTSVFDLQEIFKNNNLMSIYNFIKFFKLLNEENIKSLIERIRFYRGFEGVVKLYKVAEEEVIKNEALNKARELLQYEIDIFKESPEEKIRNWIEREYSSIIEDILDYIEVIYENDVKEEFKDLIDVFVKTIKQATSNLENDLGKRLKRAIKMRLKRSNHNYKIRQAKILAKTLNLPELLIDLV